MTIDLPTDAQQVQKFGLAEVLAPVRVEAVADLARRLIDGQPPPQLGADDLGASCCTDNLAQCVLD